MMDLVALSKSWKGSANEEKRSLIGPVGVTGVGATMAAGGGTMAVKARNAHKRWSDLEFDLGRRRVIDNSFKQAVKHTKKDRSESKAEDARAAGKQRIYEKRKARAARRAADLDRLNERGKRLGRREARVRGLKNTAGRTIKPMVGFGIGGAGAAALGAAGIAHTVTRNRRIDDARKEKRRARREARAGDVTYRATKNRRIDAARARADGGKE